MDTHIAPPLAGPTVLNADIQVITKPLAAPLWCCSCFPNQHAIYVAQYYQKIISTYGNKWNLMKGTKKLPQLYFAEGIN